MNDYTKIQALMVYFHHWGRDEIKAEQDRKALHQTMDKIKTLFIDEDLEFAQDFDFVNEIRMMRFWVQYGPYGTMNFLNRIANILLSSMGGCDNLEHSSKNRYYQFASSLNISVLDVFRIGMTEEDMLSVNAIVAL
jgi:hypothetical protein